MLTYGINIEDFFSSYLIRKLKKKKTDQISPTLITSSTKIKLHHDIEST